MSHEAKLIERIRRKLAVRKDSYAADVKVGIGDDAAVIRANDHGDMVITTDAFLENVHFLRKTHPPDAVGYKALARATSDLAAMGAKPRYFLLSMALPDKCTGKWLDHFLIGMGRAAKRFGLTLIGGDTTSSPTILLNLTVIGLTVTGDARRGGSVLRSGAKPGDVICVSGRLGEAELGLQLVLRGLSRKKSWAKLLVKHLYPDPRLPLGHWLAKTGTASAMIDTSDGLSTDLGHICRASGVGANVFAEQIPTVSVPPKLVQMGIDPLQLALHGGEDYEVLFTVPEKLAARLPRRVEGIPITAIGKVTHGKSICLINSAGQRSLLNPAGWDPFRK